MNLSKAQIHWNLTLTILDNLIALLVRFEFKLSVQNHNGGDFGPIIQVF